MHKDMPYYSTATGAEGVYHVFADCLIGSRIKRADRLSGIGPRGVVYPRCAACQESDRMILDGRLTFHPKSGRARRGRPASGSVRQVRHQPRSESTDGNESP